MTSPRYELEASFVVYPIRGLIGTFHLLYDANKREAVLIDTGLGGEVPKLKQRLKGLGLSWKDIVAILLTHGHLDHVGNLAEIKRLTDAPVFAHSFEQAHIDGTFNYQGPSKWCGRLEGLGRWALNYHPVKIDHPFADGMELPYWGGLRVIHLPGHTDGHCGFYSQRFNLLFAGDLFADFWFSSHFPPKFLNSCPELLNESILKTVSLSPQMMIPNHYDGFDGKFHKQNFDKLVMRL